MSKALKNVNTHKTSQDTAVLGKNQVKNNAGGYVFRVTDEQRLQRFLIIGTDGGTFYASEKRLTDENTQFLVSLIERNEDLVAKETIAISKAGRAKQNSPAIFAAAALAQFGENKEQAREVFNAVVRTGTHLFEYISYVKNLGGFGRAKRKTIASWYTGKSEDALAYQLVKYRQRSGWTHGDVLRQVHPQGLNKSLASFALGRGVSKDAPAMLHAFEDAQKAKNTADVVAVLKDNPRLPWEVVPTQFHKDLNVWKTLFENGSLSGTALLRNITRLARLDAFKDLSFAVEVADKIKADVSTARIHPISYLVSVVTHKDGQMVRSNGNYGFFGRTPRNRDWTPSEVILDALDDAFYASFETVEPSGTPFYLGVDVSGSMGMPAVGIDLSCAQVAGAMAMVIARTERASIIRGFAGGAQVADLGITSKTQLPEAMSAVHRHNFGTTDASLIMQDALNQGYKVHTFATITDNETWAGNIHPFQALKKYRRETGINARLVSLACSASDFTIADPSDAGMLDIAGFDASAPRIVSDFAAGNL